MASLLARFHITLPYTYKNISQSSFQDIETDKTEENTTTFHNFKGISWCHAICLYTLLVALATALALTLMGDATTAVDGRFGSYERGFNTEIRPDKNTLALKKVKFYGGIVYDENGTASITPPPPGMPDYFGVPSHETDHAWNLDLKDRFIAVAPKDWPPEAVEFFDQDLVHGTIRLETNGLHALHCLNYIRKSLSLEYYGSYMEGVDLNTTKTEPKPYELHLKHCLTQIHQLIMCQLDMTPIPRTLRPTKHIHHADTDMWHVCRDFGAMRTWMYPSEEHHT